MAAQRTWQPIRKGARGASLERQDFASPPAQAPPRTPHDASSDKTLLTLTTGADGTATGKLPINSRIGTDFWVKQVKAPAG
ncbi:hypothetical protein AB0M39_14810 [Streptomyces sp. NPDC051907]|uniref:hypothetical protein n=1 Tax=Streptomyces sp. NPDC051907 TaxID=3155284 RepID=UPI00342DD90D